MIHQRKDFGTSLVAIMAVIGSLFLLQPHTLARTILVDGSNGTNCSTSPYECWDQDGWEMDAPGMSNLGHISRCRMGEGEYIWIDTASDERRVFSAPDPNVDLLEFRITGDSTHLYFYAEFSDLTIPIGPSAACITIAIDIDQVPGSGHLWLGSFPGTNVADDAAWEWQFVTLFDEGNNDVLCFNPAGDFFFTGLAVLSEINDVIEIAVPWMDMGLAGPPVTPLRFTVVIGHSDTSEVLDVVSNYGDPGSTPNTWEEVSDGVVDYHFDLFFEPTGNVRAPVLITEVYPFPSGPEPEEEWMEIINNTNLPLNLSNYKVGDEETIDAGEGMFRFPGGVLDPGEYAVIANWAETFLVLYGMLPNFTINPGIHPVPAMIHYIPWAPGPLNFSNMGDEVLVLDPFDTVVDVVHYGDGSWPGTFSDGTQPGGTYSMERMNPNIDTNVIFDWASPSPDFVSVAMLGNPTPGDIDLTAVGDDFSALKKPSILIYPNPFNARVNLSLVLPQSGNAEIAVYDIRGKKIGEIFDGPVENGQRTFFWDGRNSRGQECASGVYLIRAKINSTTVSKSFDLVK